MTDARAADPRPGEAGAPPARRRPPRPSRCPPTSPPGSTGSSPTSPSEPAAGRRAVVDLARPVGAGGARTLAAGRRGRRRGRRSASARCDRRRRRRRATPAPAPATRPADAASCPAPSGGRGPGEPTAQQRPEAPASRRRSDVAASRCSPARPAASTLDRLRTRRAAPDAGPSCAADATRRCDDDSATPARRAAPPGGWGRGPLRAGPVRRAARPCWSCRAPRGDTQVVDLLPVRRPATRSARLTLPRALSRGRPAGMPLAYDRLY